MSRQSAEPRRAARVLLVDPGGATLLVGGTDPARPERPPVWLPPGGGLEPDDPDTATAARRELSEETGLWLDDVGPVVAAREVVFGFAGRRFAQTEDWFAVRVPRFEPVPHAWSEWERASLRGLCWWTPGEPLDGEVPADVVRLLADAHASLPALPADHAAGRLPRVPVEVGR